jgi:hypothetical protein
VNRGYWHNYDTGKFEMSETPTTDEHAKRYLPQGAARDMYDLVRRPDYKNMTILDAMLYVLEAVMGEPHENGGAS